MSWNYRIVRYANGTGLGLHEVHYDQHGKPSSMTKEPASFQCDEESEGPKGIQLSLAIALQDAIRRDIFNEPKEWAKEKGSTMR